MKVTDTPLAGVKIIEPRVFTDERGYFLEHWNARTYAKAGIEASFVQDNHSCSARGVLRGLHFQSMPQPQGKLVRAIAGAAFDVAVDLRRSSPTFGRWTAVELSATNRRMLWIPVGFAHGFLSLQDGTEIFYKCTDFYAPEHEQVLRWDDPAVGIAWPLADLGAPRLAPRDAAGKTLGELATFP